MIKPECHYCHKELKEFGGILFSPPDHWGRCDKYHVCVKCYQKVKPKERKCKNATRN